MISSLPTLSERPKAWCGALLIQAACTRSLGPSSSPAAWGPRKHLPPLVYRDGGRRASGTEFASLHQARDAYERDYILKKLDDNHGNVSRTAEALGLERSHLYRKMKTLGIAAKE